ncbi:DUF2971 domain-containing protein [Nevskia sp.]|uniref:DUF2971 domain-containing protein n=1 Tax=Nevskia sp. TaxID=1929292 RepID=UPI003F6EAD9A
MWRIYSPNHLGVRISTSTKLLRRALLPAVKELGATIRLDEVNYLSQFNINKQLREIQADLSNGFSVERATDALLLKRKAFDHEAEYRAVLHLPTANEKDIRRGLKLKVNPHWLIDSILLDPRAPDELAAAFTFYLKEKIKFKKRVAPSVLYKTQTPLIVEDE